jgi:chromosomal replication initiation ATPase DnaA
MMGQCLEPPKPEEEEKEQPTMPTFPAEVQELIDDLNAEQMQVFKMVFSHLLAAPEAKNCPENGGGGDEKKDQFLLMLHGEAGSGKTHLYKKICKAAEIMVIIFGNFLKNTAT